jgi:Flp pilus assembly pilin Flp
MIKNFLAFVKDEKGAITTVEIIGYTILLGGAAALVGFALTGAYRGLTSDVVKKIKESGSDIGG